ncbi:MAG: hypothetical protein ACXV8Q_00055 [Methylobacter sp.]
MLHPKSFYPLYLNRLLCNLPFYLPSSQGAHSAPYSNHFGNIATPQKQSPNNALVKISHR